MTSDQQSLFPAKPDRGAARRWEPPTSTEAAESMQGPHLAAMQQECLDVLVAQGGTGVLDDIVAITNRQKGSTSRRLADLEQAGLITKTDQTRRGHLHGRRQVVWRVVDDG